VEVREMRNAETILAIIQERGRRGLPLEDLYRQLFNPDLYLMAYGKIYRNQGAMTPGITEETTDGMSLEKIQTIIDAVRQERYRWTPGRRVYIDKKNSRKKRPLGIPTWGDKLLHEVIRLLLEAFYEPQFSDHSHGFRSGRGCHTALREICPGWRGTVWFIEGDISSCFDNLDHPVLMSILREKLHDNRFLRLIESLLQAGYLENWNYSATYSGTPQGGVVSPILANIYLDRLDRFVEETLLPAHNQGAERGKNPAYECLIKRAWRRRKRGRIEESRAIRREAQKLPSIDPFDPDFRRLRYVRYADDFLLGFAGPKEEAEEIKRQLRDFLRDHLKLELSEAKTLITHARTEAARFLGYDLTVYHNDAKQTHSARSINGGIGLKVPREVIGAKCHAYMEGGQPIHRKERTRDTVFSVVNQFQQEYRGIVEYYRLADNLRQFSRLRWTMDQSLGKTLACKLKISIAQVWKRYGTTLETPQGPRKGLEVRVEREGKPPLVARWGGISLKRQQTATLNDQIVRIFPGRADLEKRLLADECELCGSQENIQVHHIRALKDLRAKGRPVPGWMKLMAARQRKTLVVCRECHLGEKGIHPGRYDGKSLRK
jgi:group II intron reverse transcriptase/maturase